MNPECVRRRRERASEKATESALMVCSDILNGLAFRRIISFFGVEKYFKSFGVCMHA